MTSIFPDNTAYYATDNSLQEILAQLESGSPPASLTLVALDVSSVTTGNTPVTALNAGHCTAGGFIQNPIGATVNLGINQIGTASGTTSSGNTTFIQPGQTYNLVPSGNAVSVISSDSSHAFSGVGLT